MHKAPAVSYPLGPSRFLALVLTGVGLTGGLFVFVLACLRPVAGLADALAVLWWALGCALAWHWWRRQRTGELHWDGLRQWSISSGDGVQAGTLRVHLDLQNHLWIEWSTLGTGKVEWMWLERQRFPMMWPELRRAVFA